MGQQPEHVRARTGRGTQRVLRGPPRATAPRGAAQGGNGTFGTVECLLDRYSAQETDCGQGMRALGPTTEAACRGCRRCPSRDPTRPYTPITTHTPITYAMPKHTSRRPPSHDAFKHRSRRTPTRAPEHAPIGTKIQNGGDKGGGGGKGGGISTAVDASAFAGNRLLASAPYKHTPAPMREPCMPGLPTFAHHMLLVSASPATDGPSGAVEIRRSGERAIHRGRWAPPNVESQWPPERSA
ncbi:hypothetical protein Salat_2990900 [Sesamum alatum]|uniref:Uncharacterized protein n=1 Tax=Sesamum alatum TaxID=300844 RepID=A0AAE1XIP4_9LAMI|nr:hypothetical protein Salat_2974600 [Sesamum alatum]KAK4412056.1 hypothetical protein Salat_2974800 [Sesamum alatum]KAK4412139.1 hypothetical protein Salat_2990900 [Sesamum alatum]